MDTPDSAIAAVRLLLDVDARGGGAANGAVDVRRLYEKLARHLSPAVGDAGLDAIFDRSIKLTVRAFPALRELETSGPAEAVRNRFLGHLDAEDPAVGAEITEFLMETFVGVLATLIGEGLAWQLLRNAWPDLPSEPPAEKAK